LQIVTAALNLPHQMDQRFKRVIQPDDPSRHVGAANPMPQALKHVFQAIQRLAIGVFGGNGRRQQQSGGRAFAQCMNRANGCKDTLFTILFKHSFFLPVL